MTRPLVLRAADAGFCPGVKRAVELALLENQKAPLLLYGEIVHNRSVVERLAAEGIETLERWEDRPPSRILIRSHGIAPGEKSELERKGWDVLDATCPWVAHIHRCARKLADAGFPLLVIGEQSHAEVQGFCRGDYGEVLTISSPLEASELPHAPRRGVIVQSTFPPAKARSIVGELFLRTSELLSFNTLCGATAKRLSAATSLACQVDEMIVVGGGNSSNTRQLTDACSQQVSTHQIETAEQLQEDWLRGKARIGVAAGASTPEWTIEETIRQIRRFAGNNPER